MTAVRIRHEDEATSQYLADVPFDQLDTVIPTIREWSVNGEEPELSGQFVLSDKGAHFEVIVHEGDEL